MAGLGRGCAEGVAPSSSCQDQYGKSSRVVYITSIGHLGVRLAVLGKICFEGVKLFQGPHVSSAASKGVKFSQTALVLQP